MSKKYYEMEVLIRGTIIVPIGDYSDREEAIECVEMTNDIVDIAENIQRNNHKEFYVSVDKLNIKEIDVR